MLLTILIENEKLDLFEEEVIELNSSVANTDDVSKINTDYSKSFTVPATDNNNIIFKHYYNADIDNTFDARTKKDSTLLMRGLVFKYGKIRLEKVNVKKQKPSSYTINFWGNLLTLKDKVKADELTALDFSALNFNATFANKIAGLKTGIGANKEIIYNFIGSQIPTLTTTTVSFDSNKIVPSIKLIEIIKAIEAKYNVVFSRDFFDRVDFQELYLWLKPEKPKSYSTIYAPTELNDILVAPGNRVRFDLAINPDVAFATVPYTLEVFKDAEKIHTSDWVGGTVYNLDQAVYPGETGTFTSGDYSFKITSNQPITFTSLAGNANFYVRVTGIGWVNVLNRSYNSGVVALGTTFVINENLPKIKVLDFLKGIFQLFKLVAIPQDDGSIYINNLDDFYKDGKLYDFTNFIDFESYDVERGTISNPINFKYQPPTTILNKKFLEDNGIAYSDETLELADDEGALLDGTPLEINLPFEQPIYELVNFTQFTNGRALQYATILDKELKDVNPKPIIFYNNVVPLPSAGTYTVKLDATTLVDTINVPSQCLGLDSQITSLNWGVEFSTWNGNAIDKTLFSQYWKSYILSVFNIKKRNFKYKAILPIYILTKLKLNDIIFIKERYYTINDYTTNLLNGETTLNLTNTFEPNFGFFTPSQTEVFTDFEAKTLSIYVSNSATMNISYEDIGFGTAWVSAIKNGTFLEITVTASALTTSREVFILVDNGADQEFRIYLKQDGI